MIVMFMEGKMSLPTITTSEDVMAIVEYLKNKGIAVSINDARAVIDTKLLDTRKVTAYKYWDILEQDNDKLVLSERGLRIARKPDDKKLVFREIIKDIKPYNAVLEWAFRQKLDELSNVEVVRHWTKFYNSEVSEIEAGIKDQAACFFRFCEGADLGIMKIGRKGAQTRLEINKEELSKLYSGDTKVDSRIENKIIESAPPQVSIPKEEVSESVFSGTKIEKHEVPPSDEIYKRVYVTHGKNRGFIEPIKKLLAFGELEAIVSVEEQSVSKPVPCKGPSYLVE
jgi:hypothetical protein